ncbi:MAG: hypothetical protein KF729_38230 [Sandaracinaceae bacterium]|nr:hypothetical protein [Sandaracinaceae bacterium]
MTEAAPERMLDRLIERWREGARRARAWQPSDDPEPVLEALAQTIALELTGALGHVARDERDALRRAGQVAMLQLGRGDRDEDELEALRVCAALARDGLRALAGRALPEEPSPARDLRAVIPPAELARLLRGELDGFAAGALAMRVRRSEEALAELRAAFRLSGAPGQARLALAAAEAARVIDPAAGRLLGVHPSLGVEAVLFDPAEEGGEVRLALYAEDPAPLRLLADGVSTLDVREGYWIGRVAAGVRALDAVLHAGERREPWHLAW